MPGCHGSAPAGGRGMEFSHYCLCLYSFPVSESDLVSVGVGLGMADRRCWGVSKAFTVSIGQDLSRLVPFSYSFVTPAIHLRRLLRTCLLTSFFKSPLMLSLLSLCSTLSIVVFAMAAT